MAGETLKLYRYTVEAEKLVPAAGKMPTEKEALEKAKAEEQRVEAIRKQMKAQGGRAG